MFSPRDLNVIFEEKIAQLFALVKLTSFIVGNPNFAIVYFKRYSFILCRKNFRIIDTLIKKKKQERLIARRFGITMPSLSRD